jgi:hypothetical protein
MPGPAAPGDLVMPDEPRSHQIVGVDPAVENDHIPTRPIWAQIRLVAVAPAITGDREGDPLPSLPPSTPGHWSPSSAITVSERTGGRRHRETGSRTRGAAAAAAPLGLCPATEPAAAREGGRGGAPLDGWRLHPGAARAPPHGGRWG